jgi:hypothetical protein
MTASANPKIVRLLAKAVRGGCDCSLPEVFDALELEGSTLEKVFRVKEFVEQSGLELKPPLDGGEIDTVRSLRLKDSSSPHPDVASNEIGDESDDIELKGSLICDLNKLRDSPNSSIDDLRSEGVLHSSLKTIAAFLTCGGGVLYVGVEDSKKAIIGIENDYRFLSTGKEDRDHWELMFRDLIKSRFHEGSIVNDYVRSAYFEKESKCIARIEVLHRTKISFLRQKGVLTAYRRQWNRTVDVPVEQFEEFIEFRKVNY